MASYFSNTNLASNNIAPGTTRFNTSINQMEVFTGTHWDILIGRAETMYEMVERAEDYISASIEEEYADNTTILDTFKSWQAANERFKIILALAENK